MSKAPKAKKATLHYQPYQSVSTGEGDDQGMDLNVTDLPLHLDPVLTGLSSNLSRNLWDDWNENDANFGMKFDMFTDEASTASTASTTASPNPAQSNLSLNSEASALTSANSYNRLGTMGYEQQHSGLAQSPLGGRGATPTSEDPQKPRANFQRSLSEDIVSMLDEGDMPFGKQLDADQRRDLAMQNMMFNPAAGHNAMAFQQQQQQQMQMHQNHLQQFQQHQMQMQLQQQLQQQQQQFQQQQMGSAGLNWTNGFNGGMQPSANASPSGSANEASVSRRKPLGPNPTALDIAAAEAGASLTGMPSPCPDAQTAHAAAAAVTSSLSASSTSAATQHPGSGSFGFQASRAEEKPKAAGEEANAPPSSEAAAGANASSGSSSEANAPTGQSQQQMNGFNSQGMMMPGFMMYPMPMMGNYPQGSMGMNMMPMGMPMGSMGSMQMPLGMNMNGMQMPMQMQLQLQLQMAQMASMNGMNGMQMGLGGMGMNGMGMNTMQMPMNVNMQQQVNPQSGMAGDVEMTTPAPSVPSPPAVTAAGVAVAKPPRSLQPKDVVRGGPGFVTIARKPEEPEMSSILKSLMDEEAKKKEKKLERNRDSARESRKKQQTYVETLENGIKRLQINRDLVRSYRWGLTGPGFGPLPCPNSPQMFDWKNRVEVVTGRSEAFSNLQNPAGFQSLMRLNRQRRTLAMQRDERERAVWKCFVVVGRQLAAMRTRVLQVQVLRTFSENPLAMELDAELQLSADQKLQLQCHAQQMFNEEVVQLTALFKIFFALRNEALRLNLLSPSLELFFRETCSFDQLQRLLQWTETQRSVIEKGLPLDDV